MDWDGKQGGGLPEEQEEEMKDGASETRLSEMQHETPANANLSLKASQQQQQQHQHHHYIMNANNNIIVTSNRQTPPGFHLFRKIKLILSLGKYHRNGDFCDISLSYSSN